MRVSAASLLCRSVLLGWPVLGAGVGAQPQTARVCVTDTRGEPLAGVALTWQAGASGGGQQALGRTGADGCLVVATGLVSTAWSRTGEEVVASLPGFEDGSAAVPSRGGVVGVVLAVRPVQQSVTVTADRGLVGSSDPSGSVAVLSPAELAEAPGLALDDRLHQEAGFELFRRTSSWTANPTTEGVSLRGLGSTAASRTLVVSDQVPLNDPFGGWVHWDEVPALVIGSVGLLRGGAADLYGSSAIGGVIDVEPVVAGLGQAGGGDVTAAAPVGGVPPVGRALALRGAADASGATENTGLGDGLLMIDRRPVQGLGALSVLSTGGYVPTAPAFRGRVDGLANVVSESARAELRSTEGRPHSTEFLRGNVLNEERDNGTPLQSNGTRLWRYGAGADAAGWVTSGSLRLFGSRETYRQSFSAIAADRNSETLTRLQRVPTDELGGSLQGARGFAGTATGALGLDVRDVRATDAESPVSGGVATGTTSISARQREVGGFLDGLWQPHGWSVAGSVRVDSFRTLDARQTVSGSAAETALPDALPAISELVASPHLGVAREAGSHLLLTANAFRAFRGPTMNELYRTGQVGQQTTLANNSLLSERATGFELGGTWSLPLLRELRTTYFWTEVNRPVTAVLLSRTASGAQTLQRENLGQIRSRGLMVEARTAERHGLDASVSYQLAVATVTAFRSNSPAQASLLGKWIPQVPRESLNATLNYAAPRVAAFHFFISYTGAQFDDSLNQYELHPFPRFDVSADRGLGRGFSVFASVQNLLDRAIDAGRTPVLTLAAPRLVQAGLRWTSPR